ncbi:hypothetical protein MRX96_054622 [Rhipicephalus microplus]
MSAPGISGTASRASDLSPALRVSSSSPRPRRPRRARVARADPAVEQARFLVSSTAVSTHASSPEDLTVAAGGVHRAGGQRFNSRRGQHRNAESGSVQLERGSGERRRRGVSGSVGTSCSAFDSPGRPSALQKARALSFVFFEQDASSTLANCDRNESGASPQRDEAGDVIENWVLG